MDRMQQFAEVIDIMNQTGLTWWVNSGTLLGLVREARILPWDHDIDIGCWAQPDGWSALESGLQAAGYDVRKPTWRRMHYVYSARRDGEPTVSVQVWRRYENHAWCLARSIEPSPYARPSLRWVVLGAVRKPLKELWRNTGFLNRSSRTEGRVAGLGFVVSTWLADPEFFNEPRSLSIEGLTFPVPANHEAWLDLRYGEWRVTRSDWEFRRDDPTCVPGSPSEVLGPVERTEPMR